VAQLHESTWQDVLHEASQKLDGVQRRSLVASGAEGDGVIV